MPPQLGPFCDQGPTTTAPTAVPEGADVQLFNDTAASVDVVVTTPNGSASLTVALPPEVPCIVHSGYRYACASALKYRTVLAGSPMSWPVSPATQPVSGTVAVSPNPLPVEPAVAGGVAAGVFTAPRDGVATITWVVNSGDGTTLSDGTQTHAIGAASAPASTWQTVSVAVQAGKVYTIAGTGLYVLAVVIT